MASRKWIAGLVAAVAAGTQAQAGLLPASLPDVKAEGEGYRWTYSIVLPTDMKLQSGNYFTMYDFAGYKPGGEMAPTGPNGEKLWEFAATKVGPTPERLNPKDDPDLYNLTWKYVGPNVTGQVGLGNFWAYSEYKTQTGNSLGGQTNRSWDGLTDKNLTDNAVPTADPTAPPPPPIGGGNGGGNPGPVTPEPGTLVLAGLGLPLVGLARRLRRQK